MVGSVTNNSAKIWLGFKTNGKQYLVITDTTSKRVFFPSKIDGIANEKGAQSVVANFDNLEANRTYFVYATVENGLNKVVTSFTTLKDTTFSNINFTFGSCALMQPGFWRGLAPGASGSIFKYMQAEKPDFMLWLGDNLYYLPKDHKSFETMFKRNMNVRARFKHLKAFQSAIPQYAIWDDHDYGPNDAGKDWKLKDTALRIFKHFWTNDYPTQEAFNGNYFSYRYYDTDFFMLDDRFFREEPCDTCAFLGETQIIWLKNKLMQSNATFKFIAIGTQLLNTNGFGESYDQYKREQNGLIDFITQNNINGVLFLTGDKHYSEICKRNVNGYPIHDITCSPLTTPALPRKMLGAYINADRIEGSDYAKKNFGKISISGNVENRICHVEFYSRKGKLKRSISIPANTLKAKE
jgi:alkaline phosphatase D